MFRFTIRDVFWLMVVVALGVAWYVDRKATQRRHLVERDQLYDGMDKMYRVMTPEQRGSYYKTRTP